MKIANYELFEIETGSFALDGGSMFGIVPKTFWEKTNPPDEKNRIELAARCLLAIGNGKIILIDSGNGEKYNSKRQEIFKFNNSQFSLERSLNKLNISADDITDLILTHLHFDHCGGNTKLKMEILFQLLKMQFIMFSEIIGIGQTICRFAMRKVF